MYGTGSSSSFISLSMLESGWREALRAEESKPYFTKLSTFVQSECTSHKVYPPIQEVFTAFNLCPLNQVKIVVIGQDPYHGPGQAHGLSFSVKPGIEQPPSLKNMIKVMYTSICVYINTCVYKQCTLPKEFHDIIARDIYIYIYMYIYNSMFVNCMCKGYSF
jgi:hypothetical protein